jgi:uncharacterized protein YxjI
MLSAFQGITFVVVESAGLARAGNVYDILDDSGKKAGKVIEEVPNFFKKILKFTPLKTLLGFNIKFFDQEYNLLISLRRRFTFFLSKVDIYDGNNNPMGYFNQKFKFIIAKFDVCNADNKKIATLKGDWKDWNFKVIDPNKIEIGIIKKKWAGFFKEIFTTADKYIIYIAENVPYSEKLLILSSAIIIDMVLKEYS